MGQQTSAPQTVSDGTTQNLNPTPNPNPEVTWWCRLLSRVIACLAALLAIILGVVRLFTISPVCIGAGVVQMFIALVVIIFEAPLCCQWLEVTKPMAAFAERRAFWQKGILYVCMGIIPVAMCFSPTTIFGAGLVFASGVFYGLMALGKKADRNEMMMKASNGQDYMKVNLVNNEEPPAQQQP